MGLFDWTRPEPETASLDTEARLSDGYRKIYAESRQRFIDEGGLKARCAEISAMSLRDAVVKVHQELGALTGIRVTDENYPEIRKRFAAEMKREYTIDRLEERDDKLVTLEVRVDELRRAATEAQESPNPTAAMKFLKEKLHLSFLWAEMKTPTAFETKVKRLVETLLARKQFTQPRFPELPYNERLAIFKLEAGKGKIRPNDLVLPQSTRNLEGYCVTYALSQGHPGGTPRGAYDNWPELPGLITEVVRKTLAEKRFPGIRGAADYVRGLRKSMPRDKKAAAVVASDAVIWLTLWNDGSAKLGDLEKYMKGIHTIKRDDIVAILEPMAVPSPSQLGALSWNLVNPVVRVPEPFDEKTLPAAIREHPATFVKKVADALVQYVAMHDGENSVDEITHRLRWFKKGKDFAWWATKTGDRITTDPVSGNVILGKTHRFDQQRYNKTPRADRFDSIVSAAARTHPMPGTIEFNKFLTDNGN